VPTWILGAADLVVGLVLAGSAAVVLIRRRGHRVGVLLALTSATWFLGDLTPYLLYLHRGPMVHLHLSYPTGRLHRWPARIAVAAAYAWAVAEAWLDSAAVTAAVAIVVALAAWDTHARTRGPARKAGLPGLRAALLFASVLGLSAANQLLSWQADTAVALVYDAVMVIVPCWLTWDLLRGGWTEATISELITQLGRAEVTSGLDAELRRALGDPGLTVGYPDGAGGYVDSDGERIHPEDAAMTRIEEDGRPIAALFHDPSLLGDQALLDGAVATLRLVISNERLRRDVEARSAALAAARRRLVEAGDEQRTLLGAELVAGPIRELELAEQLLRTAPSSGSSGASNRLDLAEGTASAQAELRRFARGLLPGGLPSGGLRGALPAEVVVDVGRLPESVELAAYFVCTEALTNAAKHALASRVTAHVSRIGDAVQVDVTDDGVGGADPTGSGLQGLADRVAALGGSLDVASPPGHGTRIVARIPVGGP
jgi:signal transduction histidine kinase